MFLLFFLQELFVHSLSSSVNSLSALQKSLSVLSLPPCYFILSISQGFDQLRIEGLLCDVTLVAGDGDEAFPVHRAMMASSSDYFKAMFTGERANETWDNIGLGEVKPSFQVRKG